MNDIGVFLVSYLWLRVAGSSGGSPCRSFDGVCALTKRKRRRCLERVRQRSLLPIIWSRNEQGIIETPRIHTGKTGTPFRLISSPLLPDPLRPSLLCPLLLAGSRYWTRRVCCACWRATRGFDQSGKQSSVSSAALSSSACLCHSSLGPRPFNCSWGV